MIEPFFVEVMRSCKFADFGVQVRLVTDGRRHAAQQRRNFRAGLHEAENVVDEEQHVQAFFIAEIFGHRQAGQSHAQARAGRLGHLAVDQRRARFFRIARDDHAGLLHFQPEVVAFAGALAHAGEHRNAAVLHGHVVNQFLNQHRLAHAGAAEQADLSALQVRLHQIHNLDAGLEHFQRRGLIFERRRGAMNGIALLGFYRAQVVHWLAEHVQHAAERRAAHRHGDRSARVDRLHAAHHAFGGLHGHGAHAAFAQVLLHLGDDVDGLGDVEAFADDAHGVVDLRQVMLGKLHVHHRPDDLHHMCRLSVLSLPCWLFS